MSPQEYWDQFEPLSPEQLEAVLRATAFEYCDPIWWRTDPKGRLFLLVNCSDLFFWGTADSEIITPDNYQLLIDTIAEIEAIKGKYMADDALELWCCRVRGMRPQKPYYKHFAEDLIHLFDACGPERNE